MMESSGGELAISRNFLRTSFSLSTYFTYVPAGKRKGAQRRPFKWQEPNQREPETVKYRSWGAHGS